MRDYDDFVDRGYTEWLPYLMYFHRRNYRSRAINTDRLGFRITPGTHGRLSTAGDVPLPHDVNLVVGSSTAFGVGAASDDATVAARLSVRSGSPWLNFGARGYNTTQELMLVMLHRHLLPRVRSIVLLTGLNDLALAGLPSNRQTEYGSFFFSGEYFNQMEELRSSHREKKTIKGFGLRPRGRAPQPGHAATPSVDERLAIAAEHLAHNLDNWRALAREMEARIVFAMQPLATWVHKSRAPEEQRLFDELDARSSSFWRLFGPIADAQVGADYRARISSVCETRGIGFLDLNARIGEEATSDEWLFVDRAHFNDAGYDLLARIVAGSLDSLEERRLGRDVPA